MCIPDVMGYGDFTFDRRHTPLFEVIDPANRVIVSYGEHEDRAVLAVIETDAAAEQPIHHRDWPLSGRDAL